MTGTDIPGRADVAGFTVRVDFTAGDHDFWGWRRNEAAAVRLARRYRAWFRGGGITTMRVVPITRGQLRQHAEYRRCHLGDCPGPSPQRDLGAWLGSYRWPSGQRPLTAEGVR